MRCGAGSATDLDATNGGVPCLLRQSPCLFDAPVEVALHVLLQLLPEGKLLVVQTRGALQPALKKDAQSSEIAGGEKENG